jgi:hypothetical protein
MNGILSAASLLLHGVVGQLFATPVAMILNELDADNWSDHVQRDGG